MKISRRDMLAAAASLALARNAAASGEDETPFSSGMAVDLARTLAEKPYRPPDRRLPQGLDRIGYDAYRGISWKPRRALWRDEQRGFEMQLFHRGFLYDERVDLHTVADGRARRLVYSPDLFDSTMIDLDRIREDLGFSGLRLHAPLEGSGTMQEFALFQGASYFRALGRELGYGLSARAIAIDTGIPEEEFPNFTTFWVERPRRGAAAVSVHALLDSRSLAGAFRFEIRPGATTVMDVAATLFPRVDIAEPGLAALTSMYYFSPADQPPKDDFRPAVHDSDGLAMWTGTDERLWRPLANPRETWVSRYVDHAPRGFGLMQRRRRLRDYQDLNARYDKRPSLWVEPVGDWGAGHVRLVELPTDDEYFDNIVAYWVPEGGLRAGTPFSYAYRLHWGTDHPYPGGEARFEDTLSGIGGAPRSRYFALDAEGHALKAFSETDRIEHSIAAEGGKVLLPGTEYNPSTRGRRLAFRIRATGDAPVEIRARLMSQGKPLTETWIYRWAPID